MADDDDPGPAHLRNMMTEGQKGPAFRNADITGYGSRGTTKNKDASYMTPDDGYANSGETYTDEWSPTNFNAGGSKRVNRKGKSDKL